MSLFNYRLYGHFLTVFGGASRGDGEEEVVPVHALVHSEEGEALPDDVLAALVDGEVFLNVVAGHANCDPILDVSRFLLGDDIFFLVDGVDALFLLVIAVPCKCFELVSF